MLEVLQQISQAYSRVRLLDGCLRNEQNFQIHREFGEC